MKQAYNVNNKQFLLEQSLRYLIILSKLYPMEVDKYKLLYLDFITCYITVNELGNILLPVGSKRTSLYLNEKEVVNSLKILLSKDLIDYSIINDSYKANANSRWFIDSFTNSYCEKIQQYVEITVASYGYYSKEQLEKLANKNINEEGQK